MDYEWREVENMKNIEDGCLEMRGEKRKGEYRNQRKKGLGMEGSIGGKIRWGRGQGGED